MPEEKCESGAQRPIRMGDYYRGDFERRARRAFSGRAWLGRDAEACSSSRSSSMASVSLPGFGFRGSRTPAPPLPRPPRRPRRPGGLRLSGGTSSVSLSTGSSGTHPRLRPASPALNDSDWPLLCCPRRYDREASAARPGELDAAVGSETGAHRSRARAFATRPFPSAVGLSAPWQRLLATVKSTKPRGTPQLRSRAAARSG